MNGPDEFLVQRRVEHLLESPHLGLVSQVRDEKLRCCIDAVVVLHEHRDALCRDQAVHLQPVDEDGLVVRNVGHVRHARLQLGRNTHALGTSGEGAKAADEAVEAGSDGEDINKARQDANERRSERRVCVRRKSERGKRRAEEKSPG